MGGCPRCRLLVKGRSGGQSGGHFILFYFLDDRRNYRTTYERERGGGSGWFWLRMTRADNIKWDRQKERGACSICNKAKRRKTKDKSRVSKIYFIHNIRGRGEEWLYNTTNFHGGRMTERKAWYPKTYIFIRKKLTQNRQYVSGSHFRVNKQCRYFSTTMCFVWSGRCYCSFCCTKHVPALGNNQR